MYRSTERPSAHRADGPESESPAWWHPWRTRSCLEGGLAREPEKNSTQFRVRIAEEQKATCVGIVLLFEESDDLGTRLVRDGVSSAAALVGSASPQQDDLPTGLCADSLGDLGCFYMPGSKGRFEASHYGKEAGILLQDIGRVCPEASRNLLRCQGVGGCWPYCVNIFRGYPLRSIPRRLLRQLWVDLCRLRFFGRTAAAWRPAEPVGAASLCALCCVLARAGLRLVGRTYFGWDAFAGVPPSAVRETLLRTLYGVRACAGLGGAWNARGGISACGDSDCGSNLD